MTVTDYATTDVVTATKDADVFDIVDMFVDDDVGSVVITDGDEPVGIVTDRMVATGIRDFEGFDGVTVEEIMTDELVTASPEETHVEVLETMSSEGIRRLPIVEDGRLAGIVTLDDVLMILAEELGFVSDVVERQSGH